MSNRNYEKKLLTMKEDLERELSLLGTRVSENGDWIVVPEETDGAMADPIDNADITEDYEEKLAILRVLDERHRQISHALDSIQQGTYGVCSTCSKKIPSARLDAYPSATTCVEHA
jgi:RNA polymerase-binding transcription factor DksA